MSQCANCGKSARGFGFTPPKTTEQYYFCSFKCQTIGCDFYRSNKVMREIKCLTRAGTFAGECLNELQIFDLAELDADGYAAFIRAIIAGYFNGLYDPLQRDLNALVVAGREAGNYIEWLGKTNVAEFDPAEWDTLIGAVCAEFDRYINEEPPF